MGSLQAARAIEIEPGMSTTLQFIQSAERIQTIQNRSQPDLLRCGLALTRFDPPEDFGVTRFAVFR